MFEPIKPKEMCIVVRNMLGSTCTERDIGKFVTTEARVAMLNLGARGGPIGLVPFWVMKGGPWICPHCGGARDGYLEADLQPIRPPAQDSDSRVPEEMPEIKTATIDVPEPATGIWALGWQMLEVLR